MFSILCNSKQLFGDPIHCEPSKQVSPKVLETYCFIAATYTIPEAQASLYSGVGHGLGRVDVRALHHNYYQWVPLVLLLQALACRLPWSVWKTVVGTKVDKLLASVSEDLLAETPVDDQVSK